MRRLVLSCLAAVLAVLGLSVASSGAPGPPPAGITEVTVVQAVPDAAVDLAADGPAGERSGPLARAEAREPVFLRLLALTTLVAGIGAFARVRTASRRRVG